MVFCLLYCVETTVLKALLYRLCAETLTGRRRHCVEILAGRRALLSGRPSVCAERHYIETLTVRRAMLCREPHCVLGLTSVMPRISDSCRTSRHFRDGPI